MIPYSGLSVTPFQPNSGEVVWPGSTAPLRRSAATAEASSSHGPRGSIARDPRRVGHPRAGYASLTATGTPSSAPIGAPACQRASEARACASAPSASTSAEGVERVGLDARQQRLEDLDRRQPPFAVGGDQLARAQRHCARWYLRGVTDFLVRRDDLRAWKVADDGADAPLEPGEVRLRVERFGLTANNVTYGLLGDRLGYWQFFAAPEGWGRIPVWGFGEVGASEVDGIGAGERFYGYFPMSSAVTLRAEPTPDGFVERSGRAPRSRRSTTATWRPTPENGLEPAHDDANAVMRPLYLTGCLIADRLEQAEWAGAAMVVLASASSKTAFSTAFEIAARERARELVGLTSASNRAFTEASAATTASSRTRRSLRSADGDIVFVDMAGSQDVRRAVHEHAAVRTSWIVGATHWESASFGADPLPGAQPEVFSAPAYIERRAHELGPSEFNQRVGRAWAGFAGRVSELLEIEAATGADALGRTYDALVAGTADPRKGYVFTL